jgi:hypothetical protein
MGGDRHLEHLPPGAQPGPQSRRRRSDVRIGGYVAPLAAVVLVSLAVWWYGGAIVSGDGLVPGWFELVAVVVAAFAIRATFLSWRRAFPGRDKTLDVRLDRQRARRGEELRATVAGAPASVGIEVTLACRVHWDKCVRTSESNGGSSTRRVVVDEVAWEEATQASPSGEARLRLPADQPHSHEGAVISFAWLVSARTLVDDKLGKPSAPTAVWVDP